MRVQNLRALAAAAEGGNCDDIRLRGGFAREFSPARGREGLVGAADVAL